MSPEDIEGITDLVKEYIPAIKKAIPLLGELKEDIIPLLESFTDETVDLQIRAIARYKDKGFSHEDAMRLCLSHKIALTDAINKNK